MQNLGSLDLKDASKLAAGNWRMSPCFVWRRADDLNDSDNWAIIYTHHRDSGLLDQSNAAVIHKALEPFTCGDDPDVLFERHTHWTMNWLDGFSIRVFDTAGRSTEAFAVYHRLAEQLEQYPVLDESHYSLLETEATFENLDLAAWRLKRHYALPCDWQSTVYEWLSQHRDTALENVDDHDGWPSEDELQVAFNALGYQLAL